MVKENLAGKRFGKLTVVSPAPNKGNKTCKIEYEAVCGKCLIKQKGRVR